MSVHHSNRFCIPDYFEHKHLDYKAWDCSDRHYYKRLDSYFDNYRGVVILVRIFNGKVKTGDEIYFMQSKKTYTVTELGVKNPYEFKKDELCAGEVG